MWALLAPLPVAFVLLPSVGMAVIGAIVIVQIGLMFVRIAMTRITLTKDSKANVKVAPLFFRPRRHP